MARRATERRAVALTAAFAVNGLLLAAFVWDLRVLPTYVEAPAVQAQLVHVAPPERRPIAAPRAPQAVARRAPDIVAHQATATPPPGVIAPPAIIVPPPQSQGGDLAGLSKALRGHLGCDFDQLARLSGPERAGCEERLARDQRHAPEYLVDQDKRGAFDAAAVRAQWFQQPFLASDPKNGCKLKVNGNKTSAPGGQEYRASFACGLSF